MGGITGWVDFNRDLRSDTTVAEKMSAAIRHRGEHPGEFFTPECILLHRGSLGGSEGRQSMKRTVGGEQYSIVLDGKLFDGSDVRSELAQKGHYFLDNSDAETVLCAFIEFGAECLGKLNGVFAFAVWLSREKTLFLARDRIGVKPLYYKAYNGGLLFGSEVKALFSNPLCPAEIDNDGLKQIFLLGPGKPSGSGIYRGICELRHAEYLIFGKNGLKTQKYWSLMARQNLESMTEAAEHTRRLITDSVCAQLNIAEPFACFLSGGLDSSIISYIAAEALGCESKTLSTFSIDYENNDTHFEKNEFQPERDGAFIKCMSDFIGSHHTHRLLKTADVAETLTEAALARDLPGMADVDSSMLLACREAKKHFPVFFSGECADEIFGGYPWYHNEELLNRDTFPWSNSLEMRTKLLKPGVLQGNAEAFVRTHYDNTVKSTDTLESDSPRDKRMREMFMLNFEWFMQNLLDRTDRMAAQSGLAVRVPLCDYRLVEYAYSLPWHLKAADGREKGIMRRAFRGVLPDMIVNRKKSPFPKTFDPWYFGYVKSGVRALLRDKTSILGDLLNAEYLETLLNGKASDAPPWYGQLMRLPQAFAYLLQIDALFKEYGVKLY
ncbi:MAG: asparagine synthase (glutamine-hydrolyzing) [Firmicutes bacterium]|nr:asparagine synthase (glutamine-hydrolyzing) [Bacillota bacterium]